jgi:tetratricopeptide (TPR) repeat protein
MGRVRLLALAIVLPAAFASAQVVVAPNMGVPGGAENVPTQAHDLALESLAAGSYSAAAEIAGNDYRGAIKIGAQRWIDSIASAALLGECLYELGSFGDAVARYEESMLVFATQPDWLLSVQFPPQGLRPLPGPRVATWGRSKRNAVPAAIPDTMAIRQRGADPQQVLQRGGVLTADYDRPVRPLEIVRLFVIALYRHAALLGEVGRESPALDAATKALMKRPAPPNHWSQAWIDIALGTAYWAQGKADLAGPLLNRGLLVGNQFDHPLTAWGLIVLGRMALDADQPQRAAELFEEATYTAADFADARALEEAFHLAFVAHQMAGTRGVPPSIKLGCEWSRGTLPVLRARLLAMEADGLVSIGDMKSAAAALKDIDGRLLRSDAGRGTLGAEANYALARVEYAGGDVPAGDAALDAALVIARPRTPRLFQTMRLVEALLGGSSSFSERQADALFARLLADPAPRDVAADPLGSLAVLATPRTDAFETWVKVAAARGTEPAIEAAEATMRHRWQAARPLGGRRVAVERMLAADPRVLPPADAARRAAIVGSQRELAALVDRMGQLRGTLSATLLAGQAAGADAAAGPAAAKGDWETYRALAGRRGQMVAAIAASREPVPLDFPPLTGGPEIRRRLGPRQLLLSFHWTASGLFGLLESRERFAVWQVRQAGELPGEIKTLARSLALFDPVAPVPTSRLAEGDWSGSIERIERMLFENSKVTLSEGIDELVIVPDGWLWYVPFELLPVASSRPGDDEIGGRRRLRDACRIRYAPTRSVAVMRFEPEATGPVGVHAGKMLRGDKPADAEETLAHVAAAVERVAPLNATLAAPIPVAAAVCDSLAVFDELSGEGPVAVWPLLPYGTGKGSAVTFGDWLAPPQKRPRRVLLPGLQTAMAGGLAKVPQRPGEDVFLAVTDVVAAGARTAVVSRWRMGGKTCTDLMTEFLREATAADGAAAPAAWQRAVDLVLAEEPDVAREPRVRLSGDALLARPLHPLLWAGYLLVDCGGGRYSPEPPPPAAGQAPPPALAPALRPAAPAGPPPRPGLVQPLLEPPQAAP